MSIGKNSFYRAIGCILIISTLISCRQSAPVVVEEAQAVDQIVVRMSSEPVSLSPIIATASLDREIYQYIFLTLAGYDYQTLELKPILIEKLPVVRKLEDGTEAYDLRIKEDAQWPDGSAITAEDVLFTYKIATHPGVLSPDWKAQLADITGVNIDSQDPKKFTIVSSDSYFLNKESLLSSQIYPKYIFDPEGALDGISLADIRDATKVEELMKEPSFQNVAKNFSSIAYNKEKVVGAGPYDVEKIETGQYIVLKKKEKYWGESYPEVDQLQAYPERMVFQFIKDETTALTVLKNDELDFIDFSSSSIVQYLDLKKDTSFSKKHRFINTQLPRFIYLMLNNEDVRLAEREVRKAVRYTVDIDRMIRQLAGGMATKVNSPIHFSKPHFNKDLPDQEFNLNKATELLELAGWEDTDENGIRDKVINGRKEELDFRFHITGSSFSTGASAMIKEACEQVGININIVEKPWGATRSENLVTGDYEMLISVITQSTGLDDPYLSYHSSSVGNGKGNTLRYSNEEADLFMELIRNAKTEEERLQAYRDFQKIIYEDAPAVYLYSPQLKLIVDNQINPVVSSARPGYFLNAKAIL